MNVIEIVIHKDLCKKIKNFERFFLLFKKLFENTQGKNQAERFEDAINKLKDVNDLFDKKLLNI